MTNHWIDIQHADVILCIGSNPAENHPISFRTRTSSKSDIYAQLRPGTDVAFIGGIINFALENNSIHREYVVNYTNAAFLVNEDYAFDDGIFSGYAPDNNSYDKGSWAYQIGEDGNPLRDDSLKNPLTVYQLLKQHYARYTPRQSG
jgi:formate dehydrogenase major subunit